MSPRRKLKSLTIKQKIDILKKVDDGIKKKIIAREYNIPASTLSTIIKNKVSIQSFASNLTKPGNVKRNRDVTNKNVNSAVLKWFASARDQNVPVSGPLLQEQALKYGQQLGATNFKASTGWLHKFKKRHGISYKTICGESAAVDDNQINNWLQCALPQILDQYDENDVFNADETGIFFKCLPNKTMAFDGDKCYGGKRSKERVTCLFATNMTGTEKLKPLVIGRSAKPRCFKGVKWLPVNYKSNTKAWMTSDIFEKWISELDRQFFKERRKILMFIDNCPAHPPLQQKLKAINLQFFPPNATSKLQPLDQGIIKSFKDHYKRRILKKILNALENGMPATISLLDCVKEIAMTWTVDVSSKTIQNCFKKAGFSKEDDEEDTIPLAQLKERLRDENKELLLDELRQDFQKCTELLNIQNVSFDVFREIESNLLTTDYPTDQDILESVSATVNDETVEEHESSDEEIVEIPSHAQVLQAFKTLKNYFIADEKTADSTYTLLNTIEKTYELSKTNMQQKSITDYFAKIN